MDTTNGSDEYGTVRRIKVMFSEDSLFGDQEPQPHHFADALENHLHAEYPDAEIEVVEGIGERVEVNGLADHDEVPWINQIIERVWNGDDWLE
jgi:hypothetical protein